MKIQPPAPRTVTDLPSKREHRTAPLKRKNGQHGRVVTYNPCPSPCTMVWLLQQQDENRQNLNACPACGAHLETRQPSRRTA